MPSIKDESMRVHFPDCCNLIFLPPLPLLDCESELSCASEVGMRMVHVASLPNLGVASSVLDPARRAAIRSAIALASLFFLKLDLEANVDGEL
jgi:hypothetical protein